MPQFDSSTYTSQIFWLFFSLSILFIFLKNVLLPKLESIFQQRYFRIKDAEQKVESLKLKISEIEQARERQLQEAKDEAHKIVEDARQRIESDLKDKMNRIDLDIQNNTLEYNKKIEWEIEEAKRRCDHLAKDCIEQIKDKMVPSNPERT